MLCCSSSGDHEAPAEISAADTLLWVERGRFTGTGRAVPSDCARPARSPAPEMRERELPCYSSLNVAVRKSRTALPVASVAAALYATCGAAFSVG